MKTTVKLCASIFLTLLLTTPGWAFLGGFEIADGYHIGGTVPLEIPADVTLGEEFPGNTIVPPSRSWWGLTSGDGSHGPDVTRYNAGEPTAAFMDIQDDTGLWSLVQGGRNIANTATAPLAGGTNMLPGNYMIPWEYGGSFEGQAVLDFAAPDGDGEYLYRLDSADFGVDPQSVTAGVVEMCFWFCPETLPSTDDHFIMGLIDGSGTLGVEIGYTMDNHVLYEGASGKVQTSSLADPVGWNLMVVRLDLTADTFDVDFQPLGGTLVNLVSNEPMMSDMDNFTHINWWLAGGSWKNFFDDFSFKVPDPCMIAVPEEIECPEDGVFKVTYDITNLSGFDVDKIRAFPPPGATWGFNPAPWLGPVDVTFSPILMDGNSDSVTFCIYDANPGDVLNFDLRLYVAGNSTQVCCHLPVEIELPVCDCIEILEDEMICEGTNPDGTVNFTYNFTFKNWASYTLGQGDISLVGVTPPGLTLLDTMTFPVLPMGTSSGTMLVSGAVPGDTICFEIVVHDVVNHENCCSIGFCLVVPECDCPCEAEIRGFCINVNPCFIIGPPIKDEVKELAKVSDAVAGRESGETAIAKPRPDIIPVPVPVPGCRRYFCGSVSLSDCVERAIYEWDFGDGTIITTPTPFTSHFYEPGTYLATLTVYPFDADGNPCPPVQMSQKHRVRCLIIADPIPLEPVSPIRR